MKFTFYYSIGVLELLIVLLVLPSVSEARCVAEGGKRVQDSVILMPPSTIRHSSHAHPFKATHSCWSGTRDTLMLEAALERHPSTNKFKSTTFG